MKIYNKIKKIRKSLGLSQADLAAELCVSQGLISNYERQINNVSPEVANKLISVALERGLTINFNDIYKT
ncbi:XRE family transcriptional regulator [Salmonella enterica subsp. enterica serovar Ramatgan]|uniref:Helix-turn-helix transcriptional regulator n=1 Tax=Salmonella enterica TaxID=28901 RepID=A0A742ZPW4_SALER|nr:XRE family transcriptional regulator [Salmonella enterica subsp. enterica serovar Ramatgan]ECM3181199.1 helix-turn-helix transcriptional regulator [Salmonella enterica subsp. enterica serovar Newport]HAF1616166.1 helix-turn-helix transcriptional regulator [Salmonella enterica]